MKPVQSVERSFAILTALAAEPGGLSDAARRVGLPKSTVARLVATLESLGAVERVGDRYHVGPAIETLAGPGSTTLRMIALAHPHLEWLASEADEAAGLSIDLGDHMRTIAQIDVDRTVQAQDWTGELAMIHTVPSGLIVMAEWPEDRLGDYLARPLAQSTAHTLVDPAAIRARLAAVREQGYAWGKEEFHEGINSVAAPVRDESGAIVAVVHVHGPAYRFPDSGEESRIGRHVATAAEGLSRSYASARMSS